MEDKRITLSHAVQLVHDGDTLALGGVTLYRRPVAFTRALLAREDRPQGLTLLCFTAGYASDLLVGAGLVDAVRSCYFGLEIFGLAPMFTQAAGAGALRVIEESEVSLSAGIRAHLGNVSFTASRAWLGTDMLRLRPDVEVIDDPYNPGQQVVAFPAIEWDVTAIHALRSDTAGNAVLNENLGVDVELALGGKRVIITAEEVVERIEGPVHITGQVVTAVVEAPQGARPTSCYPLYPLAGGELLRYVEACNADGFDEYLADFLADQ